MKSTYNYPVLRRDGGVGGGGDEWRIRSVCIRIHDPTRSAQINGTTTHSTHGVNSRAWNKRHPLQRNRPIARRAFVLGSRPMHILPPVIVVVVVAPAFDNDAIVQRANAAPRQ